MPSTIRIAQRGRLQEHLDATAHVLRRGETGLAHHALQHHAPRDCDLDLRGLQLVMRLLAEFGMQVACQMFALEVVRESDA